MSNVESPSPWFPPTDRTIVRRVKGGGDPKEFAYGRRGNIFFLNEHGEAISKEEHDHWADPR